MADVLGPDLQLAGLPAADVRMDCPWRHLPAGRPLVLVVGNQRLNLIRIQCFGWGAQNTCVPIRFGSERVGTNALFLGHGVLNNPVGVTCDSLVRSHSLEVDRLPFRAASEAAIPI